MRKDILKAITSDNDTLSELVLRLFSNDYSTEGGVLKVAWGFFNRMGILILREV